MRQFLVERLAVRGPAVLPKFLAMIGNHDNERVVQNPKLLQFVDELLQSPVVMKDLTVVPVNSFLNKAIRIDSVTCAHRAADNSSSAVPSLIDEALVEFIELRCFGRFCELLFESGGRPIRRVRI